jgi:hypothetical protein
VPVGLSAGDGLQFAIGEQSFDDRFLLTICSRGLPSGVVIEDS